MLKREVELLLERVIDTADVTKLPIEVACDRNVREDEAVDAAQFAINQCYLIRFDAKRLTELVEADSKALRLIYAISLNVVDNIRIASHEAITDRAEFLARAESGLADIQTAIEKLFPNEILAG